jgi:hypothetical protein
MIATAAISQRRGQSTEASNSPLTMPSSAGNRLGTLKLSTLVSEKPVS